MKSFKKKLITGLSTLSTGTTTLLAGNFIVGTTTDIDPKLAGDVYEVGIGIYERAEIGDSIKVMTVTDKPSLEIDFVKEDYPNKTLARNARKAFENSLIEMLGKALVVNKDKEVSGYADAPRFIRELRNHIEAEETTAILVGNTLWMGNPEFSFIDHSQSNRDLRLRRPTHGSVSVDKFLSPFSMDEVPDMPECRLIWFDPTGDFETNDDAYRWEVANFWNCMLSEVSIPMGPIHSNVSTTLNMAFDEAFEPLPLILNEREEDARMLTVEDMRPRPVFVADSPAFTHIWVGDLSPSQAKVREAMARRLSDSRGVSGQYHGLFVFENGDGTLYSENADVLEIAAAFRQVKPDGGADIKGSFSATLRKVRNELRERNAKGCLVNILSDVGPSVDESVSESERYNAILQDIIADGHEVTFVRTNRKLNVRKFIPKEIKIKVVDL